jgi:hypothetical protein
VGLAAFAALTTAGASLGLFGIQASVMGALISCFVLWRNLAARRRTRTVRITPSGLDIEGRVVPMTKSVDGFIQPGASGIPGDLGRPSVRLLNGQRQIVFEADAASHEEALALLRTLGLDAARKRAQYWMASRAPRAA